MPKHFVEYKSTSLRFIIDHLSPRGNGKRTNQGHYFIHNIRAKLGTKLSKSKRNNNVLILNKYYLYCCIIEQKSRSICI